MCVSTQRAYSRTGIIYNVTPRAVGILINKRVGNRYIQKRVNIRVEHIKLSQGRQVFLDRVKKNEKARIAAKEKGGESCDLVRVGIGY
jgi:large subunit ribosomal protein L21e